MATEKRLIPDGKKVTLEELLPGTIFAFGNDCIAVKSEYRCNNGLIEAFIIGSGEQFWGGVKTAKEQNALMVQPLAIEEVDAVEVVHGEWSTIEDDYFGLIALQCSVCNQEYWFEDEPPLKIYNYCPNCGAKMDGDRDG